MSQRSRARCPVKWGITSVSVRTRDARYRVAQAYRIVLGCGDESAACEASPNRPPGAATKGERDESRHLCQSLHGSPATEPDH